MRRKPFPRPLTPALSRGERERRPLTPSLSRGERERRPLTPALSRGERERRSLTPALSQRERGRGNGAVAGQVVGAEPDGLGGQASTSAGVAEPGDGFWVVAHGDDAAAASHEAE
jgi:hypothetical protein